MLTSSTGVAVRGVSRLVVRVAPNPNPNSNPNSNSNPNRV